MNTEELVDHAFFPDSIRLAAVFQASLHPNGAASMHLIPLLLKPNSIN